jgi:hypothetical protein
MASNPPSAAPWLYKPSTTLAIVATILFGCLTAAQFYLSVLKYRSWYFIWVFIGALLETIGYLVRIISTRNLSESVRPDPISPGFEMDANIDSVARAHMPSRALS